MKRTLFRPARWFFALGVPILAMALGCVERERLEPDPVPLWERYDAEQLSSKDSDFILRSLQIGGRIECTGDRFHEQTTEIYARTRLKSDGSWARVKQLFVRLEYVSGLFKGARSSERVYNWDRVQLKETVRIELNPGGECSCVRVLGIMWVLDRNRTVMGRVCPEDA